MKKLILVALTMMSFSAFAEHDAIYCGKFLEGKKGLSYGKQPTFIIQLDGSLHKEKGTETYYDPKEGYAAVFVDLNALNAEDTKLVARAINNKKETIYCVKARWGGAAYTSWNIEDITLLADHIERVDYFSTMEK